MKVTNNCPFDVEIKFGTCRGAYINPVLDGCKVTDIIYDETGTMIGVEVEYTGIHEATPEELKLMEVSNTWYTGLVKRLKSMIRTYRTR